MPRRFRSAGQAPPERDEGDEEQEEDGDECLPESLEEDRSAHQQG